MEMRMNVGYIGLGIMGSAMAQNLLRAGHTLFVYNRTPAKCDSLVQQGAIPCASPAETAEKSEVVFINVTATADVEQVIFNEKGIASGARIGLIIVDNSTISARATREFAARLQNMGIEYIDAPVTGGDVGARAGTLAIMAGGEPAVFEKVKPLLEAMGKTIRHVGPVGMGQTCKAINQLFCALHMVACCEGIELARQSGLDPAIMVELLSCGAGGSWALEHLGPKILADDFAPGFRIDLLVKDLQFTMELAREAELPLSGTSLAQMLFSEAQQEGLGKLGTQGLYQVIQKRKKT